MSEIRTYEYKLYLGISIEDAADSRQTLILTKDAQEIKIDKKICIISLNGIKFYRKIYEPGLIEAEVSTDCPAGVRIWGDWALCVDGWGVWG